MITQVNAQSIWRASRAHLRKFYHRCLRNVVPITVINYCPINEREKKGKGLEFDKAQSVSTSQILITSSKNYALEPVYVNRTSRTKIWEGLKRTLGLQKQAAHPLFPGGEGGAKHTPCAGLCLGSGLLCLVPFPRSFLVPSHYA